MRTFTKAGLASATALAAGLVTSDALAQVEIITVTAQKREQTLQDTPVAVSAVTAETLEDAAIRDIRDLQASVPTLRVSQFSRPGVTEFAIRGIGTSADNIGLEPSVGVFVDGVYRARAGAAINDFLSLERVEVIRGPQSTLFGRNTPAGVVSFVTRAPEYEFGGEAEFTYGNYNQYIGKATVTAPIVEDTLAFRLDGVFNARDGFIDNRTSEDAEAVNDRNRYDVRGQLLWEPSGATSVRLIADFGEIDEACCAAPFLTQLPQNRLALAVLGATLLPDDPWNYDVAFDGRLNTVIETQGVSAEVNHVLGEYDLTSITALRSYRDESDIDADFTDVDLAGRRFIDNGYDTFTQEFRIAETNGGRFDWLAGAYYYHQELDYDSEVPYGSQLREFLDLATRGELENAFGAAAANDLLNSFGVPSTGGVPTLVENILLSNVPNPNNPFLTTPNAAVAGSVVPPGTFLGGGQGLVRETYAVTTDSLAFFGQGDWYVTDRLTVTAGLRFTYEEKEIDADINIQDPWSALNFVQLGQDLRLVVPPGADPNNPMGTCLDPSDANTCAFLLPSLVAQLDPATAGALGLDPFTPLTLEQAQNPQINPFLLFSPLQFNPPAGDYSRSRDEDNISGLFRLAYDVNDNWNVYASYSQGFKAGGFNVSAFATVTDAFEFDAETATTIEIGAKASLLQNTLQINAAAFDNSLEDFQANNFTGTSFVLDNAGEVITRGIELDTVWSPNNVFTGTAAVSYLLDAEYESYENAPCDDLNQSQSCLLTNTQDLSGRRLAGASKMTASVSGTLNFSINGLNVSTRGEAYYRSSYNTGGDLDPRKVQEEFTLFNASVTVAPPRDGWEVQLWGRNLTDEEYLAGSFSSVGQPGSLNAYPGDPLTYGLSLRVRY